MINSERAASIEQAIDSGVSLRDIEEMINTWSFADDKEREDLRLWAWAWYQTRPPRKLLDRLKL